MNFLLQKNKTVPKLKVLITGLMLSLVFVFPSQAEELVNITDIKDCRKVNGDAERLACYDIVNDGGIFNEQKLRKVQVEDFGSETMPKEKASAPAPVTPAPTPAPAPETPTPSASPAPQASSAAAPAEEPPPAKASREPSSDRIYVTIVRLKKGNGGFYYFQTSEGQVWKQQNAMSWNLKAPFEAKIKKGTMGSFFLVHDGGKSTRVKRVR